MLIDVWAKAAERAGSTEAAAVVAGLEKMPDGPTLFGPRTFTSEIHHQNRARHLIVETNNGTPAVVDEWTIPAPAGRPKSRPVPFWRCRETVLAHVGSNLTNAACCLNGRTGVALPTSPHSRLTQGGHPAGKSGRPP